MHVSWTLLAKTRGIKYFNVETWMLFAPPYQNFWQRSWCLPTGRDVISADGVSGNAINDVAATTPPTCTPDECGMLPLHFCSCSNKQGLRLLEKPDVGNYAPAG